MQTTIQKSQRVSTKILLVLVGCALLAALLPAQAFSLPEEGASGRASLPTRIAASVVPMASDIEGYYAKTAEYQINSIEPNLIGYEFEWTIFSLARGGALDESTRTTYLSNLTNYLESCNGNLGPSNYTDYSRLILALTSLGIDASSFKGFDLTAALAEFENTVAQGINGPIYALLALDSGTYEIPTLEADSNQTQATRQLYVEEILAKEVEGGGWSHRPDDVSADMTAMALQALAPYQNGEYAGVEEAIERGLALLSSLQNEEGGFGRGTTDAEGCVQVIVALNAMNIELTDPRFVKNDHTVFDAFMTCYDKTTGGVSHAPGGTPDNLATNQGTYMLNSLYRALSGHTSLYDMTDLELAEYDGSENQSPSLSPSLPDPVETTNEELPIAVVVVGAAAAVALVAVVVLIVRRSAKKKQQ